MWHSPEDEISKLCCKCCSRLYIYWDSDIAPLRCKKCEEFYVELRCTNLNCSFKTAGCPKCLIAKDAQKEIKPQLKDDKKNSYYYILPTVMVVFGLLWMLNSGSSNSQEHSSTILIERLREKFPSQKNETLYHILSVLERGVPTVKSITLLHKNDKQTSHCLAKELVNIFSESARMGEVSFGIDGVKYSDYGEVLEHYHNVVKKFRVLVTNLSEVPGSVAKVFHSLCDEVSSDVKPSLFIFILRQEKETNSRPLEKATAILREAWSELPDSDLFPLLSRVVKNVVDVVPEKNVVC